jgi:signal transduction histidine kinase/Tfp pilus assembly protein PilF
MGETSSVALDGVFGGRYQPTRLLKRGLGIDTYLGTDLSSGEPVVVKRATAAAISPGALLRLEHDAEALRSVGEPTVAPLLAMGHEGDVLYLVTPFVHGTTLARRLARTGRLWVPDALAVGRALMRALQAAHSSGVLHRDVKPANVILGDGSPPDRVTLVDFGIARSERADAALRGLPLEAVAYLSPEQAGLIYSEVGERSDLYCAGVVLFECLAGRPPFEGATVRDLLRQHLGAAPPALGYAVPEALAGVVQRLLAKDPRERYQSAAATRADLDEIAAAMERGVRRPAVTVGAHDRGRTLTEAAFVGRERDLRAFEAVLARALGGESPLLLVEGESGAGKTRMLDHAAVIAREQGAWVLRGQATDRAAAQRPLQIFERVAGEVVEAAHADPEFAAAVRARLGEHLQTLSSALPTLLALLPRGTLVPLGPEVHGETRLLPALIALLDALGTPERPAVLLLDDCQWLDELSLKLVAAWHRAHADAPGAGGVLVAAAYRGDEVPIDSPLRTLAATRTFLAALSGEDVARMAESMAGPLPAEATALVTRLSEGNPFLVAAVLEGLVECGALVDGPGGWELEPRAMAEAQSSRRAGAFLAQRLDKLSSSALDLLSVGAVLGKSFELKLAADLADHSSAEAMAGVTDARRRRLVWLDAPHGRCMFVHDRVREAVLERLTPRDRARLHQAAALALEEAPPGPDRAFDLAYHFDAAGDPAQALPHALSAAAEARARYALETAERFYRIAERGAAAEGVSAATRQEVAEALGDVLLMRGRYDEAEARLGQARALAGSAVEQAAIEGKLGELAFKRGDVCAASVALERALRLLGRRVPARRPAVILAMLWQALVQAAHGLLPRRFVQRGRTEERDVDLLAARVLSRLAYAYWFRRGQAATFWAHLSELNLAERHPPSRELAQACSEHAISVTGLPRFLFGRGVRYAERGLAIRRELGDVWGQGQSLNFYGILLYAFGRYAEAREKFGEALRVLRRTGDRWEANIAALHVAYCHLRLGAVREAFEESRRVHRDGAEIGDAHATGSALEVWAKATGGAVPEALVQAALRSSEGDAQTREMVLQAEGVRLLGAGRPHDAAMAFAEAEDVARAANLESEYVSYVPIWLAHALRLEAARAAGATGVLLPARLREADAALRRGLRSARRYRGNLPMALRERAHLRAMRGRFRAARRDLDASLAEAERQGARLEAALSLLARGELAEALGWRDGAAEASRARALLHELGADFACTPRGVASGGATRAEAAARAEAEAPVEALEEATRRLRDVQGQLAQTAKMAAVGTLVAGLAHETNGPLGVILGHATTALRRVPGDDPLRSQLEAIERQARRAAALVGTFLDFARQRPAEREEVELPALVQQVASLASLKARHREIEIQVAMRSPGDARIRVSRTQIESALLNLVDNAVDASPAGAVVRIEAEPSDRDARRGVEVRVRDRGAGIDPDVLARAFDPFFTTKPQGRGTGLGLPLARQFIEDHDGRLSLESRPGEGTTVRLWLPISEPEPEPARAGASDL